MVCPFGAKRLCQVEVQVLTFLKTKVLVGGCKEFVCAILVHIPML